MQFLLKKILSVNTYLLVLTKYGMRGLCCIVILFLFDESDGYYSCGVEKSSVGQSFISEAENDISWVMILVFRVLLV